MTKETTYEAITMLREYAENRWFTGEREVSELRKKQEEENADIWAAEIARGEAADAESEYAHVLKAQEEERDALFSRYSKKYHAIHDLIKKIEAE